MSLPAPGTFYDVVKHVLLTRLLVNLRAKQLPFTFTDCTAGPGIFALNQDEEVPAVAQVWSELAKERQVTSCSPLQDYVQILRRYNMSCVQFPPSDPRSIRHPNRLKSTQAPVGEYSYEKVLEEYLNPTSDMATRLDPMKYYPGTPLFARYFMRPCDNALFTTPSDLFAEQLSALFQEDRRIAVECGPLWNVMLSNLPPRNRNGICFMDLTGDDAPDQTIFDALRTSDRWPSAQWVIFYPLNTELPSPRFIYQTLLEAGFRRIMGAEIDISNEMQDEGFACGMAVTNPPLNFGVETDISLQTLGQFFAPNIAMPQYQHPEVLFDLQPPTSAREAEEIERVFESDDDVLFHNIFFLGEGSPEPYHALWQRMQPSLTRQEVRQVDTSEVSQKKKQLDEIAELRKRRRQMESLGANPRRLTFSEKLSLAWMKDEKRRWPIGLADLDWAADTQSMDGKRRMPIFQYEREMKAKVDQRKANFTRLLAKARGQSLKK